MKNENLQQLLKEGKITAKTLERVSIAKSFIEKKYSIKKLKEEEKKNDWDIFFKKMDELNLSSKEKDSIKKEMFHKEAEYLRMKRKKICIREFESIGIIGRGAFGEVRVCRHIESGDIVAIKKMRKEDMVNKNQIIHVRTEKEILTNAKTPWIVNLRYSFQDDFYLYLVMDFLPGGDLMSLLMKKDILPEDEARFYIAELILAVESVHNLNCIHRDLKPDNILIDKHGHIQLSDFGLSKLSDQVIFPMTTDTQMKDITADDELTIHKPGSNVILENKKLHQEIKFKRKNRMVAFSTVGTPDYIAPEVFGQQGYGPEVDWWSVGVIFFEMIVGYPPFFSENPSDTCQKIVKWKQHFVIPLDANLSLEAENLIRKLVTVPEQRLGVQGVEEIKKHAFFKGVDWSNIRKQKAAFIPDIKNDWDTKYFDSFPEQDPFYPLEKKQKKRKDINYAGFTYNRDMDNQRVGFLHALEVLETVKILNEKTDEKFKIIDEAEEESQKAANKSSSKNLTTTNMTSSIGKNDKEQVNNCKDNLQKLSETSSVTDISKNSNSKIQLKIDTVMKTSTSPEQKSPSNNNIIKGTTGSGKGINIIPLKNFKRNGEAELKMFTTVNNFTKDKTDRFSPKRVLNLPQGNVSPKQKLVPLSCRNVNNGGPNLQTDPNKYANKIYANITVTNSSKSPKHSEVKGVTNGKNVKK